MESASLNITKDLGVDYEVKIHQYFGGRTDIIRIGRVVNDLIPYYRHPVWNNVGNPDYWFRGSNVFLEIKTVNSDWRDRNNVSITKNEVECFNAMLNAGEKIIILRYVHRDPVDRFKCFYYDSSNVYWHNGCFLLKCKNEIIRNGII